MLNRTVLLTALIVWLLISFVPSLSAAHLLHMGGKGGGGGRAGA